MKYFYITISVLVVILLAILLFVEIKKGNVNSQEQVTAQYQKAISAQMQQSINSARQKGREAMVKATLSTMRAEAELIYNKDGSYLNICKNGLVNINNPDLNMEIEQILTAASTTDQTSAGLSCYSSAGKYTVSFSSKSQDLFENLKFCIDNSGYGSIGTADPKTISCQR